MTSNPMVSDIWKFIFFNNIYLFPSLLELINYWICLSLIKNNLFKT